MLALSAIYIAEIYGTVESQVEGCRGISSVDDVTWVVEGEIRVGDQNVRFARNATRWLGMWLDSALTRLETRRRYINRSRKAEAQL